LDRTFLDLGDARGDGEHDAGTDAQRVAVHLSDEVTQHRLRHIEVGDHAILHRPDCGDVARRAAEHAFRFLTDGTHFARGGIEGDDRRLPQYDAAVFQIHERVGRTKVDPDVV